MWYDLMIFIGCIVATIALCWQCYVVGRIRMIKDANEVVIEARRAELEAVAQREFYKTALEMAEKRLEKIGKRNNKPLDDADWWKRGRDRED